ncbi:hypothetical protein ACJMK2_000264 [Sinanodonta woodiana]|uniref:PAS domain-containing serine/threonine-protein kinase n=1 Tax=Sinanodonta woodiana TaxID=1069815 RepID=A0ABD3XS91_SINWO
MADELNRYRQAMFPVMHDRRSLPMEYSRWSPAISHYPSQHSTPNIKWKTDSIQEHNHHSSPVIRPYHLPMAFGSPSYPSPLDRIRLEFQDLSVQLECNPAGEASFETNQSFPKVSKSRQDDKANPKTSFQNFRGIGLNDVSFSPGHSKGSFAPSAETSLNKSLAESWSFYNYIGGGDTGMVFPSTVRNPNKAICTINSRTSEILVANEMACELFGYEEFELIGMELRKLIKLKPKKQATICETHLEPCGDLVEIAGKVVDAIDKNGLVLPVSVWVKRLEYEMHVNQPRCLVVMEPVERTVALVKFDSKGTILSCDEKLANLHGYLTPAELRGTDIKQLIPAFRLPERGKSLSKDIRKQRATGRTRDGATFPLSIAVKLDEDDDDDDNARLAPSSFEDRTVYFGVIWVFANISGMITFLPDGCIHSINDNFALMLFGYNAVEVIGKNITALIPDFYEILDTTEDSYCLPSLDGEGYHKDCKSEDSGRHSGRGEDGDRRDCKSEDSGRHSGRGEDGDRRDCKSEDSGRHSGRGEDGDRRDCKSEDSGRHSGRGEDGDRRDCKSEDSGTHSGRGPSSVSSEDHATQTGKNMVSVKHQSSAVLTTNSVGCRVEEFKPTLQGLTSTPNKQESEGGLLRRLSATSKLYEDLEIDEGIEAVEEFLPPLQPSLKLDLLMLEEELPPQDTLFTSLETIPTATKVDKQVKNEILSGKDNIFKTDLKEKSTESTKTSYGTNSKSNQKVKLLETNTETKCSGNAEICKNELKIFVNSDQITFGQESSAADGDDEQESDACLLSSELDTTDDLLAASVNLTSMETSKYDQLESSGQGHVADISSNGEAALDCVQSQKNKRKSHSRYQAGSKIVPRDYIPECSQHFENTESSTSTDYVTHNSDYHRTSIQQFLSFHNNNSHAKSHNTSQFPDGSSRFSSCTKNNGNRNLNKIGSDLLVDSNQENIPSSFEASLRSFEMHERENYSSAIGLDKSRNGSKSSDYSSQGSTVFPEGSFTGQCRHKDESKLGIIFQIKRVELECGSHIYCMWVSRDPEDPGEATRSYANLTLASSLNSTRDCSMNFSLGEVLMERAQSDSKDPLQENEETEETEEERIASEGPYREYYKTQHSIGKGAFGFVKLALRKTDDQEVVVKFIKRTKVLKECWVRDPDYGLIPLEVSLLTKLDHANIVKVLDVYENDHFLQMVMEKHGSGMDLFEFIDRSPNLDEPLTSHIFRQMVSAVSYLHKKNILHRDIKDENVILNEQFQIKLIDFGAAAFMEPGKMFGTFCGTLEYCSPEVLKGNKYHGPELEVWSMGVTLYTLVFGENPFFDVDETIKCELKPPFEVSSELMLLLLWLLHEDPKKRATISRLERNPWVKQPVDISQYKWSEVLPNSEFHGNTASDNRADTTDERDEVVKVKSYTGLEAELDQLKSDLLHQLKISSDSKKSTAY